MAIGGPDKAARLDQLRSFARCQVWSGYRAPTDVRAEVLAAVRGEVRDDATAQRLTDEYLADAETARDAAAAGWPEPSGFDRLQAALAELRSGGVVVLEAVDDHWDADERLASLRRDGGSPRGLAYFTITDVWHAVEHGMLEVNVWHGDTANVAPGDELLAFVCGAFQSHGLEAHFDEGRIEVGIDWQRRAHQGTSSTPH